MLETLRLGLKNLLLHKLRSLLTALGIIIGIAAVVAIAAYGEGSKQEALAQIRRLGATNIIVRSTKPPVSNSAAQGNSRSLNYGIRRLDVTRMDESCSPIDRLVQLKRVGYGAKRGAKQVQAEAFATTPDLQDVASLHVERGRYLSERDLEKRDNVCVIGATVAETLFPLEDPLESELYVNEQVFKVIGVLRPIGLAGGAGSALVGRDLNFDIHMPLTTGRSLFGDNVMRRSSGSMEREQVEVTEVYLQVPETKDVLPVAAQVRRVIELNHEDSQDVTITVPLELLEEEARTQLVFNSLIIFVAGLSLLVGGIGIMNIMLASVTERIREIGIRRALGATRRHIIMQFLVETTVLATLGGLIGVALGVSFALLMATFSDFLPAGTSPPMVTLTPVIVSFMVATAVGVIFGLYPAIRAANQDPIVALRHD